MALTLTHFLILGAILFAISIVGIFLNRKNIIVLLMAIELMLLAVNMNFIAFSHYLGDAAGQDQRPLRGATAYIDGQSGDILATWSSPGTGRPRGVL